MFTHYLHLSPLYNTPEYIDFVKNKKTFKSNSYFFFFNVFWLVKHKMFSIIPLWILMMISSIYLSSLLFQIPFFQQDKFSSWQFTIPMIPHILFSGFIYKIQFLWKENIIWKYRSDYNKQVFWLTSMHIIPTIVLFLAFFFGGIQLLIYTLNTSKNIETYNNVIRIITPNN